jgi:hypothetical protein
LEGVHETAGGIFTKVKGEFPPMEDRQELEVINLSTENEQIVLKCGGPIEIRRASVLEQEIRRETGLQGLLRERRSNRYIE